MKIIQKQFFHAGLFIIILMLSGCYGETHCPGYDRVNSNWIPYSRHQYVKFTNGTDTVRFVVEDASYSESFSYKNNCDCACEASAFFTTTTTNEIDLQMEGHCYYPDPSNIEYEYDFIKYGYSGGYYGALRSDNFYFRKVNGTITDEVLPAYEVNGVVYNSVIRLESDTMHDSQLWSEPEIWRIFIADSVGVIQFDEFKTGRAWKIIATDVFTD